MGYIGAPTAVVLTNWLMPLLLFLYVRLIAGADCWTGLSRRALTNWIPMIKLAIPGFVMLEAEYLAFEILTLAASYFSTAHVAAQSILSTTMALTFQLGFAVAIATSTRTANLLGAGMGAAARITARVGLAISGVIGVLNLLLIIAVRKQYVRWFSDDQEVIELFMGAIWVGATFQLVDSLGVTTAGILRGQGKLCARTSITYHRVLICEQESRRLGRTSTSPRTMLSGCRYRLCWRSVAIWSWWACGQVLRWGWCSLRL